MEVPDRLHGRVGPKEVVPGIVYVEAGHTYRTGVGTVCGISFL